jgi:hypothetical protein
MTRLGTNLFALMVVGLGSAHLTSPTPARAADEQVCCTTASAKCCGQECEASADGGCDACSGWWDCLWM